MALRTHANQSDPQQTQCVAPVRAPANQEFGFNSFSPAVGPVADEPSLLDGVSTTGPVRAPAQTPAPAGPPQQPAQAPAPAPVDPEKVRGRATDLWRAMDGWGTNEDNVMTALRGLSPQEVAAVRAEFANHYGVNLDQMIADEMGGDDLAEAQALLTADPVEGALTGLTNAVGFWGDDEAKIEELMRDLSPEDRLRMTQDPRWQEVRGTVHDALGGSDREVFEALETGDQAAATAIRLDDAMGSSSGWYNPTSWGTDESAVYEELGRLPADQRAQVEQRFNERMAAQGVQTDLRTELGDELSGADQQRAEAVLAGNTVDEQVARIAQTMEGWGTNEAELFSLLEQQGMDPDQRAAIAARYQELHNVTLDQAVLGDLSGTDLERAQGAIANNGQQDPAFMLFYGMEGMGTDEQLLRDTLRGKSAEEIQAIRENWNSTYAERYGADFDAAFEGELSGRDHFDIVEIQMRGEPQNDQERAEILELQYSYERGDRSTAFGRGYMDLLDDIGFSSSASQMDRQHERLQALYDENGQLAAPEGAVEQLYGWGQSDLEDYRTAKDTATEALATGAEITVAAIVTVVSQGAASPWLVAAIAGAAGGVAGMATRAAIQGEAYGEEAIAADALKTVLAAGVSGAMEAGVVANRLRELAGHFGDDFAREVAEAAIMGGANGAANGAVEGIMDGDALRQGVAEYLAGIAQNTGMGALTGSVSGVASHGVESAVDGLPAFDQKTLTGTMLTSATSNAGGALAETAIDPATYQGRPEDVALAFLRSAGTAAASGAIDGAVDYTTRARVVTREILVEGKTPDQISDLENLSELQRAQVLDAVLRSADPRPSAEVLERLGYRPDLTPIAPAAEELPDLGPADDITQEMPAETSPEVQEVAEEVRAPEAEPVSQEAAPEVALAESDDMRAYREELVLQELIRLEAAGQGQYVDQVLANSGDVDQMELMLMQASGGSVSGQQSALGHIDASTPEGAAQVLLTAGLPQSQLDSLDTASLDAMARFAQAYSSGDFEAAGAARADLGGMDANTMALFEGAIIAHHYGLEGAQALGRGPQAQLARVLNDGFEASPEDLAAFREHMGDKYDEYLGQLQQRLGPDHEAWSMMSEEELVAVYGYTTNDYGALNPALRTMDPTSLEELMPYISAAESGLQKIPALADMQGGPVTTIRGTGSLPPEVDAQLQVGETFTDRAFYSTSQEALSNFDGGYQFVIEGETGRAVDWFSAYEHEKEVLYPTGTPFVVTERVFDEATGRTVIRLKEAD